MRFSCTVYARPRAEGRGACNVAFFIRRRFNFCPGVCTVGGAHVGVLVDWLTMAVCVRACVCGLRGVDTYEVGRVVRTCPGPMIVPFQLDMRISSLSSRPYEHDPSPMPFSPFSSSSSRRKLRGTASRKELNENAVRYMREWYEPLAISW